MICINNKDHGYRIAERAGVVYNPVSDPVISRVERGELYGGVLYNNYSGPSTAMHVAGFRPGWLNRQFLSEVFWFPFYQLGCERVFGYVPEGNERAMKFDLKLGFREVARVPGVYASGAAVVLCMERDECRWIVDKLPGEVIYGWPV